MTRRLRVSFLDRLKREADQQRLQAEQLAAQRDEREMRYRSQIEPRMKALTSYLEGLAATLLEVKPPIVISMSIQGYGDLSTVPFWDYKVEHERRHRNFSITMTWSLRVDGERTPVVRADGVTRVKTLTSIFRQYHLGGIKEEKRTPQGELSCATFHARGYIKARMMATISAEDPVLRLMFENASWLGASRRQVPWEQIDDDLFDRIARFVVREDDSLFTEELPDALRQKLRKDPEPAASVSTPIAAPPAPVAPRENVPASTPSAASEPAPRIETPVQPQPQPAAPAKQEVADVLVPGVIPAPAPMTEGEVIEIDESKLGLADFDASEQPLNVFASGAVQRAQPAPALHPSAPASASRESSAAPPMAAREVRANDVSTLAAVAAAATMPAAAAAPVPAASATPPAGGLRPEAARSPPPSASSPPTAAAPPTPTSSKAAAPAATADDRPAQAAPTADEPNDEAKEREAAMFRLRMRAMMARLRSDEDASGGS